MRKLLLEMGLVMLLCIGSVFGAQTAQFGDNPTEVALVHQDQNSLTMRMEIGSVDLIPVSTKEGQFVMLAVNGFARSHDIGRPDLPAVNRIISIPFGCQLQVEVISQESVEFYLSDYGFDELVMPAQPSLSKSDDPDYVPFEYNREVYAKAGYYAMPLARAEILGILRAHRLGRVSVAPFEYDPVENKVKVYTSVTVRIDYINPDWLTTQQTQRRCYSPFFEVVYKQFFNYNDDYPVILDDLVNYPVKYVIIADRMFESQLAPFIEWKTQKGFTVMTYYTDDIGYSNSVIRSHIQGLYQTEDPPPSFVLFVGDDQQIPAFDLGAHITDLNFCEYTNDHMPEIYYGRWSAQTTALLQPQIDKTLEYEMYTMPDPGYLGEVTLVAGVDSYHAPTWGNGQINYGTDYYFNLAHGIDPNVWLYPDSDDPGAGPAIRQTINDGIGLVNYSAHCGHDGWSDPSFTSSDIRNLSNAHKYLLSIGNCCLSNTFGDDYSTPCFGEVWLQEAEKGGFGHIGGTNSTYWDEDYWWGVGAGPVLANPTYEQTGLGAYDGMFHDHGEPVTDHYITNDAVIFCGNLAVVEGNGNSNYYWEIYHLMGDPSIMTYLGMPAVNNAVHDPTVLLTAPSFTVQADPGSYVGISMNGEIHGQGYIDQSGMVEILLDAFPAPGTADIVVTGQNKQPYISTITVITPEGPYVIFDEYGINDAAGNGDGRVDFGESILLDMQLTNVGPDQANNVTAVISTDDDMVTITDNTESFGSIDGNFGIAFVEDAFAFDVSEDCEDGHIVSFTMLVTGTSTDEWTSYFTIPVHAPIVSFVDLIVDDSQGNGDGIIDPGETVNLSVTVLNSGSCQAVNVTGVLGETDDYVEIINATSSFGNIAPDDGTADNSDNPFIVSASNDYPPGHSVVFTLNIQDDNGYETDLQFTLRSIESFEHGNGGYTGEGVWQWGSPTSGPGEAYDGDNVWGTVLGGQYPNNADDNLITPYFTINSSGAYLSFYHWYNMETNWDGGNVHVSTDGISWELIYPNSGYPNPDVTGLDDEPGFSGESGGWQEVMFDLSAYNGQTIKIRFRFGTDGSVTRDGWYIDGVVLFGGMILAPEASISETSFFVDLEQGDNTTLPLLLSNSGTGQLDFNVTILTDMFNFGNSSPDEPVMDDVYPNTKEGYIITERGEIKLEVDPPSSGGVITRTGGPDEFGYTFIDSDEDGGPVYEWIDITGVGTPVVFNGYNPADDGYSDPIPMGMTFEFYGLPYTDVQVSTNGWVSFNVYTTSYLSNYSIPNSNNPNALIAVQWDDLDGGTPGICYTYYDEDENRFIVSWVDWAYYPDASTPVHSFQVILDGDDNSIVMQYGDIAGNYQDDITIGIEDQDGEVGLEYCYNNFAPYAGLAIKFKCPLFWLTVDPMFGSVEPDQSLDMDVTFDAAELTDGLYFGEIRIETNDPGHSIFAIPCTLNVGPVGVADNNAMPAVFTLDQNYPNPFNPITGIAFGVPVNGHVNLEVYDIMGRKVTTLVDEELLAGTHNVIWDGTNADGAKVTSGVYFYKLTQGENIITRKMIMLK